MIYLQLFWEFFKTGLFAIGGGMAAEPLDGQAVGYVADFAVCERPVEEERLHHAEAAARRGR